MITDKDSFKYSTSFKHEVKLTVTWIPDENRMHDDNIAQLKLAETYNSSVILKIY